MKCHQQASRCHATEIMGLNSQIANMVPPATAVEFEFSDFLARFNIIDLVKITRYIMLSILMMGHMCTAAEFFGI